MKKCIAYFLCIAIILASSSGCTIIDLAESEYENSASVIADDVTEEIMGYIMNEKSDKLIESFSVNLKSKITEDDVNSFYNFPNGNIVSYGDITVTESFGLDSGEYDYRYININIREVTTNTGGLYQIYISKCTDYVDDKNEIGLETVAIYDTTETGAINYDSGVRLPV